MVKGKKTVGLVVTTLALVLALMVSACGPASPAEKEKTVKIGIQTTFTGAIATVQAPVSGGLVDYMAYINEQGGIDGIRIDALWYECETSVSKCITAHRRFADAGVVAELTMSVAGTEALVAMLAKDEVPIFFVSGMCRGMRKWPAKRWIFAAHPGYESEAATFMKWVKDNWTEARLPKMGLIFMDAGSGWDTQVGFEKLAPQLGIDYLGYECVPLLGCIDTTVELLRLADKEPDWIYSAAGGAPAVTVSKDAARLKLQEKGIKLGCYDAHMSVSVIKTVGEDAEGWYYLNWLPSATEAGIPGMKPLLAAAKKNRGWEPEDVPNWYTMGWLASQVTVEFIRLAIDKVGLENLTGRAVRDAMATIKDFNSGIVPPITMTEDVPYTVPRYRIGQVQGGRMIPVTDWLEPAYYPELK